MSAAATAPAIRVRDLRVRFSLPTHDYTAVGGVSFDVQPGTCLAIVGESGSGKSVTARALVGLAGAGSSVEATAIEVLGEDVREHTERDWKRVRGKSIGFVLQDALVSFDPLHQTGVEVGEAIRLHERVGRDERNTRVIEQLRRVGIPDPELRAKQYPHELSGGLRQRALIASATVLQPPVIIADEPTTALDTTVQRQILELLGELRAAGSALILISHDLSVVSRLADEVIIMRWGEVVERGAARDVLSNPQHSYTRQLVASVPGRHSKGQRLSKRESDLSGLSRSRPLRIREDTPVIVADGLRKTYVGPKKTSRAALDGVSFSVERGQTLGIVGESGSGKSTVARTVLGLSGLDAGAVTIDGEPWSSAHERDRRSRRHRIQFVQQDPLSSFDPRYTVRQIVTEALESSRERSDARVLTLEQLLEQVGLDAQHASRRPRELSGGERQRVAIARALATEPEIIVFDEAVSALDVSIQAQVLDLLLDLQRAHELSYLFISHDLGVIRHVSDRVIVMKDGRIVETGEVEQVFERPQHPYTVELVNAVSDR